MAAVAATSSESACYSFQQLQSLAGQIEAYVLTLRECLNDRLQRGFSSACCTLTLMSGSQKHRTIEAVPISDLLGSTSKWATELVEGAKKCSEEMAFQIVAGTLLALLFFDFS